MIRREPETPCADTPFSQASFEFRSGNDFDDRSYVIYDLNESVDNTPFSPGSFVYRSGKQFKKGSNIEGNPERKSSLLQSNTDGYGRDYVRSKKNKCDSSSAMLEYSSSFAYQNHKNKQRLHSNNKQSVFASPTRPQDLRIRSYLDSEFSDEEEKCSDIDRKQHQKIDYNIPSSISFDGGIYGNRTDLRRSMINPHMEGQLGINPKSTQTQGRPTAGS